ncbi:MAG TPA: allantoicase [Thermoanaerobaculia bacterium]|nr:allantoicase [Thermoanaerobaculia bacterium]
MADTFQDLPDLASERLGGSVLYATDDYFAEKENLLKPAAPIWKEHEYTDRGKWMDGWESRRKREPGHDFAIIRLGAPGIVRGVVVDTSFFRGNYPEQCSIEGCHADEESDVASLLSATWTEILPLSPLKGDSQNLFTVTTPHACTHLRLHIYPDGGVARFRVHGEVVPEWRRSGGLANVVDLAAIEHGAEVLTCSDMFFGPRHNLIMPGRAHNMSDGWETRRRRGPGHDWVIVRLATEGVIRRIEVDTNHFKGNYPDTCSIEASNGGEEWRELLPRTRLQAHTRHQFIDELAGEGAVTHLRLNVFPDGGVSRLRVFGVATDEGRRQEVVRRVNALLPDRAAMELRSCCGSTEWVRRMIASRPFGSWQSLISAAESIWFSLGPNDWREAFAAHPRIGERGGSSWSRSEQAGAGGASEPTLSALAGGNRDYEQRFGHVFLVCATGKSADEMLAMLTERMQNSPDDELRIAAAEQMKITALRLLKLVTG